MTVSHETQATPPLMLAHAVVFTVGVLALPVSVFARLPHFLLVAGVCFLMTAGLLVLGVRVTFTGPTGSTFRKVLGPARVAAIYMRIAFWVLIGVLVTAWGVMRVIEHDPHVPTVQDPMIGLAR